jgi:hypothetical protein
MQWIVPTLHILLGIINDIVSRYGAFMAEHLEVDTEEVQKLQLAQDESTICLACSKKKEKLISSAEEQYKKVRAEHGYKRLKINAGYNALLAKQQGAQVLTEREQSKLKDFEERWTKVARYESAAVRDEGKALVADYESQLAAVTKEIETATGAWMRRKKQSQRDLEY